MGQVKTLRRASSFGVGKGAFVLEQPVLIEESIPDDLEHSVLAGRWNFIVYTRHLADLYMRSSPARLLVLFAAVLSCVVYVVETYSSRNNHHFETISFIVDLFVFGIFVIDYLLNILVSTSKWRYVCSFQGAIDLASLASIVNIFAGADLSFLPLFRLLRVIKILRLFRTVSIVNVDRPTPPSASEAIAFEIFSLVVGIILAIFLAASVLYTIIQQDNHSWVFGADMLYVEEGRTTWFDCVYIVMVIIATLGFGDFVPFNVKGRIFVVMLLSVTLVLIPLKVGQLIDTIGKQPRYMNDVRTQEGTWGGGVLFH
jgi:voltage-gated potassium channel